MINSHQTPSNRTGQSTTTVPRAAIHKQILDAAASRPEASMEEIADEINGANTVLVEKVLEEYGDPADAEPASTDDASADLINEQPATTNNAVDSGDDQPATNQNSTATTDTQSADESITLEYDEKESTGNQKEELAVTTETGADLGDETDEVAADSADETDNEEPQTASNDRESTAETRPEARTDSEDDATQSVDDANGDPQAAPAVPDPDTLTETQLTTLRAIHERPTATQAALADQFDITAASISQRVNSIDGFDWTDRRTFTDALFGLDVATVESPTPDGGTEPASDGGTRSTGAHSENTQEQSDSSETSKPTGVIADEPIESTAVADQLATLTTRVDQLNERLADQSRSQGALDPALSHKVIRACFDDDTISEDEEREVLQLLIERNRD